VAIREDDLMADRRGYNFHWAPVAMTSGHDFVVLENMSVGDIEKKNEKWFYEMYGPPTKKGQTFHDKAPGTVGVGTSMAAGVYERPGKVDRHGELMTMTVNEDVDFLKEQDRSNPRHEDLPRLSRGRKVEVVQFDHDQRMWRVRDRITGLEGWVPKDRLT